VLNVIAMSRWHKKSISIKSSSDLRLITSSNVNPFRFLGGDFKGESKL
jgi:hypothetical protein